MSFRRLFPKRAHNSNPTILHPPRPRFSSSTPSSSTTTPPTSPPNPTSTRLSRLLLRLPLPLRRYTASLLSAPTTHITSFLILHELTAIIPLFGLAAFFHYSNWLPESWTEGKYVREGVERFGRWFSKKGWFGFTSADSRIGDEAGIGDGERRGDVEVIDGKGRKDGEAGRLEEEVENRYHVTAQGGRILVEVATAYAITKVLLPARILLSVWGTPWFARVVVGRFTGLFGRLRGGKGGVPATRGGATVKNRK